MSFPKRRRKVRELPGDGIAFAQETDNVAGEAAHAGFHMDSRARVVIILGAVLVVLYVFALICPKSIVYWMLHGREINGVGYTISWFVEDLESNVQTLVAVFAGRFESAGGMVRNAVIAFAGAGLALTGAVYQGTFRNALVAPSTLGVMTGAQMGMFLWVVFSVAATGTASLALPSDPSSADILDYVVSSYGLAGFSFAGCLVVVGLVLVTMRAAGGGTSAIMMIITGQVIGGVVGAVCNTIRYYYITVDPTGAASQMLTDLTIASFFREFGVIDVFALGIPLGLTFAVVMRLRQRMMLLAFEEGERRTLGIDARKMQVAVIGLCTLLTAIIVSFCGTVGFVGFLVPHLARRLVGPNFKYLLPAATLLGAVFVLGAYTLLAITVGGDYVNMVGMYISIAGSVVFLVTALRGKGAARGSFR